MFEEREFFPLGMLLFILVSGLVVYIKKKNIICAFIKQRKRVKEQYFTFPFVKLDRDTGRSFFSHDLRSIFLIVKSQIQMSVIF
jgi:hypothetical protein